MTPEYRFLSRIAQTKQIWSESYQASWMKKIVVNRRCGRQTNVPSNLSTSESPYPGNMSPYMAKRNSVEKRQCNHYASCWHVCQSRGTWSQGYRVWMLIWKLHPFPKLAERIFRKFVITWTGHQGYVDRPSVCHGIVWSDVHQKTLQNTTPVYYVIKDLVFGGRGQNIQLVHQIQPTTCFVHSLVGMQLHSFF